MLTEIAYDRQAAVRYALKWAYARNPRFYDFEDIGGDCTNFISQCLYAGCGVMNYAAENGWYYINTNERSPSWTGVIFLQQFLLTNEGAGVYGRQTQLGALREGDVVQLIDREGNFYHTVFVSYVSRVYWREVTAEDIYVCAHSYDARNRRLSSYPYADVAAIEILGARRELD